MAAPVATAHDSLWVATVRLLLRCPQCERVAPVERYRRARRISRYGAATMEIYRCPEPACQHHFAPLPPPPGR